MRWGSNNPIVATPYGSLTVAVRQENPYAALRIWPAHAFSHRDSLEARSAGAFLPGPRYESSSAAEVKTHLWRTVAENPQARAAIAAPVDQPASPLASSTCRRVAAWWSWGGGTARL